MAAVAQSIPWGWVKRFCYYVKEFYIRKVGYSYNSIPRYLLCEFVNEELPFNVNIESRADGKVVFRRSLLIGNGYNRFFIPTEDLNYQNGSKNYLYLYPDGNKSRILNIISLELVNIKKEYYKNYFPDSQKKVKCVVWDLDNTLWNGIIGEDGVSGIRINTEIVKVIKALDAKGIIISISSKNYEEKAIEALKKFDIYEYFVCPMINWHPKSENIKKIVQMLDIGMDTFVFVDDSEFELNEVKENCLGIRVCNVKQILSYIEQDSFDVPVTEESRKRRQSYKDIMNRNRAMLEFKDSIDEFLVSCKMKVSVAHPTEEELIRCYELIQRTNQLNLSAERLTLDQVEVFVESPEYECYRIKVHDRFGDYGLVGFAVFNISNRETVVLEHFVFSCRAARKKIEENYFRYMMGKFYERGFKKIQLTCKRTEKNQLMQQVLEESRLFGR